MFIVQGISEVLRDADQVREGERLYDAMLHRQPIIYWNIYLQGIEQPNKTIHTQMWISKAHSEAFGVSPEFQAHRTRLSTNNVQRARMVGPLSPGYWEPIVERIYHRPPTGREDPALGVATHGLVFVKPGREAEYEAAEQAIADKLAGLDGVYWFCSFQNLGQPNAYSRIIHWRDGAAGVAAESATADEESRRQVAVEQETAGGYRVVLMSDWPERRSPSGGTSTTWRLTPSVGQGAFS